ncbi:MAG: hypothetical protein DDT19_01188 [Syntrophomonadaceae bacterium]|nr:hypothetical protein [Bacillota bacterium]
MISQSAKKWGVDEAILRKVLFCESSMNPKAWNKQDPNGGSKGIAQFQDATFAYYSKLAGISDGDVWNPEHALSTMSYMFSIGEQSQWSCYNLLYGVQKELPAMPQEDRYLHGKN